MTLVVFKDAMIILALSFFVVFLAFGIRVFLAIKKAVDNANKSISDINNYVFSAKAALVPMLEEIPKILDETKNNIGTTLENINQLAIVSKNNIELVQNNIASSLENIDNFVIKAEEIAVHFDEEAADVLKTFDKISTPLKSAIDTISVPVKFTSRFSSAFGKAFSAFKSKLSSSSSNNSLNNKNKAEAELEAKG